MSMLILAEQREGSLTLASRRLLGALQPLGNSMQLLVLAPLCEREKLMAQAASYGIGRITLIDARQNTPFAIEAMADALAGRIAEYQRVVAVHQAESVALLALLAARLMLPLYTDATAITDEAICLPLFDEQAAAWFALPATTTLLTLRSSHFAAVSPKEGQPLPVCEQLSVELTPASRWRSRQLLLQSLPEQRLDEATVVVAGGRPLGKRLLPMLTPLARKLGAAVGATRGAVDAGHAPIRCQIGQTGAHIAPEIYLAIGLSGAPQHMAGIGQSRCIIAINKDANAPIVQQADYWLQGDMLELVPALTACLQDP